MTAPIALGAVFLFRQPGNFDPLITLFFFDGPFNGHSARPGRTELLLNSRHMISVNMFGKDRPWAAEGLK